ncbi:MAG: O-antigen ligase family protein [Pseudomonadota bacterium]
MRDMTALLYSPSEVSRGATFRLFFWMLAIAAVLGHRAYAPILLAPLAAIDWRHAWFARRATFRSIDPRWIAYFSAAFVFSLYTAISATWSPTPSMVNWAFRIGICFIIAPISFHSVHYLTPAVRERGAVAVALATMAMLALLTVEGLTNASIRQALPPAERIDRDLIALGRGSLLLILLVWPVRRILSERMKRPWLGWAVVVASLYPALKFSIVTNAAMLFAGGVAYFSVKWFGKRALVILLVLTSSMVVVAPLIAMGLDAQMVWDRAPWLPDSWVQRLFIWERAGDAIASNFWGGGVGYARSLSRPFVAVTINGVDLNTMPLHPHNLFLHVWMDLGFIGACCLCGFMVAIWRAVSRVGDDKEDLATVAAIVASLAITAMTEWSIWQVWRFAAVWIALIAVRIAASPQPVNQSVRPSL